jgi:excinuclease ABC subunit A
MSKQSPAPAIRLRGVRHNNLKNFGLDLPLNQLIVITGLSGSGKSSLAFDTLFAEGQRRYIETFSPYARQFFDRMDKPQVDSIEGIPPAIAIEQRNTVKTTRSTVGTMTEICDYMKLLWPHLAQLYCRACGQPVRKDSPQQIWATVLNRERGLHNAERLITFDLPLTEKLSLEESLSLITKQGYQRLLLPARNPRGRSARSPQLELNEAIAPWGGRQTFAAGPPEIVRVEEAVESLRDLKSNSLTVVQDHVKLAETNRTRFIEACEQAYHFGKGKLTIHRLNAEPGTPNLERFSNRLHCAACDIEYREPSSALFSFNHPLGACPSCRGFGRMISIDYDRAIPDCSKTLADGAVKPWQTGMSAECQDDLRKMCRLRKVPTDVPFEKLPKKWQDWVINGDPGYGKDEEHQWPKAWYGVKGYFRWLESKAYKMHVRVLLSRYRAYTQCPDCKGKRFQPEALLYRCEIHDPRFTIHNPQRDAAASAGSSIANCQSSITLADFYQLAIRDAARFIEHVALNRPAKTSDPIGLALNEVGSRLAYLVGVGLGYLTLDRPTRTLSGGETERVSLTTCLGTRLVNTLYVLDEPSVGLHPRDTGRLIRVLQQLRDLGNTVVVVEHEASVIQAANQIVDLGPGHGESGGHLVFQGTYSEILESKNSITGQYLSGRKQVKAPERRPADETADVRKLTIRGAAMHNLNGLSVDIPLGRFVCVTGVSGSGKTTLIREILLPALEDKLKSRAKDHAVSDQSNVENRNDSEDDSSTINHQPSAALTGWEHLGSVVLVDQSPLGKTPRSNPAVYIGAFDDIRELFAQTDAAKQRGLNASAFSFNSAQGQCERCRGAGFEKIEMQFLSDVFIRCPDCAGRRYRPHILEVKVRCPVGEGASPQAVTGSALRDPRFELEWSIADLLDATVDEVLEFLAAFTDSRPAHRAAQSLRLLQEVGLGYLRLGQPINTLSGGESQRLKLVSHLAESVAAVYDRRDRNSGEAADSSSTPTSQRKPTLFLFDEPTTGLHFDDVRVLLKVFHRLVDAGHSVIVIEHNLDVIKCADWIIDLGPEAGDEGGQIVAAGTPEDVARCEASHTGHFLQGLLGTRCRVSRASPRNTRAAKVRNGGTVPMPKSKTNTPVNHVSTD